MDDRGFSETIDVGYSINMVFERLSRLRECSRSIKHRISALSNSGGGDLNIKVVNCTVEEINEYQRSLEQIIENFAGTLFLCEQAEITNDQIRITVKVKPAEYLLVVDYNLFLPSQNQVLKVGLHELINNNFSLILHGSEAASIRNMHQQSFLKNQIISSESKTVQFKLLQNERRDSLGDRMTNDNNKFKKYVSAFGNHAGGHIYYGVNDDGEVVGQEINEQSMVKIEEKITRRINECIWLDADEPPRRGRDWDVNFVPVQDPENPSQQIPEKFVVVVYVAKSRGVFAGIPECYHIIKGTDGNLKQRPASGTEYNNIVNVRGRKYVFGPN